MSATPCLAPWTEAHQREALRRSYEIATLLVGEGRPFEANWSVISVRRETEAAWRADLAHAYGPGFDSTRIEREVQRVRALAEASTNSALGAAIAETRARADALVADLAEGRKVLEIVWRGESGEEHPTREQAAADKSHGGATLARVIRIRRVG